MKKSELQSIIRQQLNEADIVDVLKKVAKQREKDKNPDKTPPAREGLSQWFVEFKDAAKKLSEIGEILDDTKLKTSAAKAVKLAKDAGSVLNKQYKTKAFSEQYANPADIVIEADIVDVLRNIANARQKEKGHKAVDPLVDKCMPIAKKWDDMVDAFTEVAKTLNIKTLQTKVNAMKKHSEAFGKLLKSSLDNHYEIARDREADAMKHVGKVREGTMKKSELQAIIREEIQNVINESFSNWEVKFVRSIKNKLAGDVKKGHVEVVKARGTSEAIKKACKNAGCEGAWMHVDVEVTKK